MTKPIQDKLVLIDGRIIRQLRVEMGLTQKELASRARVTKGWLGGVEARGVCKANVDYVEKVARAVGVAKFRFYTQPAEVTARRDGNGISKSGRRNGVTVEEIEEIVARVTGTAMAQLEARILEKFEELLQEANLPGGKPWNISG